MPFNFKSSYLASSISVMTLAVGLAFAAPATQRVLAQTVTQINGAGATFPNVLYTSQGGWFNVYGRASSGAVNPPGPINPNVQFNYNSIGSGAGISAFLTQVEPAGTNPPISFGASDAPLRSSTATPVPTITGTPNRGPAVQVPVVAGAVTLSYNPQGLNVPPGGLRFSRATYCGILNGNITNFNDQRITQDNNGVQVSTGQPIRVVRRADSSGTTFLLTNHLETICQTPFNWNRGVGTAPETDNSNNADNDPATINWPTNFIAAAGGSGVSQTIDATVGGFGYVENATRNAQGLPAANLQNRAGTFVAPTSGAVSTALQGAPDLDPDPRIITITVPNPAQAAAYPIIGVTYQLYYDIYSSASVAAGIRGFINDFVADPTPSSNPSLNANTIAADLGYAPLSSTLKTQVRNVVTTYVDTTAN